MTRMANHTRNQKNIWPYMPLFILRDRVSLITSFSAVPYDAASSSSSVGPYHTHTGSTHALILVILIHFHNVLVHIDTFARFCMEVLSFLSLEVNLKSIPIHPVYLYPGNEGLVFGQFMRFLVNSCDRSRYGYWQSARQHKTKINHNKPQIFVGKNLNKIPQGTAWNRSLCAIGRISQIKSDRWRYVFCSSPIKQRVINPNELVNELSIYSQIIILKSVFSTLCFHPG